MKIINYLRNVSRRIPKSFKTGNNETEIFGFDLFIFKIFLSVPIFRTNKFLKKLKMATTLTKCPVLEYI
jgi:hypothetical protein